MKTAEAKDLTRFHLTEALRVLDYHGIPLARYHLRKADEILKVIAVSRKPSIEASKTLKGKDEP